MKLLVLFLSLSLTLSYGLPILGGYQLVSSTQAQSDNQIQSLINAAIEKISTEGNFSSDLFLSAINSIYQQSVNDATNYKFNCDFQDKEGQTIKATFEATYNYSTAAESVDNLDYSVSNLSVSETVSNTFVKLSTESLSSSVKSIVEYGYKQVLKFALDAKEISSEDFEMSNIVSVATQVVDSAVFYNCSVDLKNSEETTIKAVFTVYSQAAMNVTVIIDYSFEVSTSEKPTNNIVQVVAPVESQYVAISSEVVEKNQVIQDALNFNVEQVIKVGVDDEQLSTSDFTLSEVEKAYSQIIGCGVFYKFKVTLESESTQDTITATFEVYYQASTKETKLVSYSYRVDSDLSYVIPVLSMGGNYTECDESEIKESEALLEALNYGANQVVLIGAQEGDVPSSAYSLFQITSVKKQTNLVGTSYKFEILLTNKNGVIIEASFTVLNQKSSEQLLLSSYSYQVNLNGYGSSCSNNNDDSDSSDSGSITVTVDVEITTTVIIGTPDYETNTTTTNTTIKSPGANWVLLTEDEIQESVVQNCINYGMNDVIQIGVQLGSFPFSKWDLTEVVAVYQKNQNWGQFYQITLHLTSAKGLKLETTFTLSYNIASLLIRLNSYFYNVGAFISTTTIATTSGFNTTTETTSNTTDLPFSESNDGLEYASNGYYKIPIHWVDESVDIQNCINFGAPKVVQIGVNQSKIPVSNYIIYKVVWVQRYISTKGSYYAIRLYLTNVDNVDLVATFTTFINKSTKDISLYTYAYSVANVRTTWYTPGGDQNSTGSTNETTVTNVTSLISSASWTALPALQIDNNQEVQDALKFGAEFITKVSIKSNSAPAGNYEISATKGISTKATLNGVFYACDVVLTSSANVKITTTYTVYFDRETESYSMSSYQYQVTGSQDTISQDNGLDNNGYIEVDVSEVENDSQISNCLNYGISEILQESESYTISTINSCYTQVINSAYYYKFDVELTGESNVSVHLEFIVFYKPELDQQVVTAYSIEKTIIETEESEETEDESDDEEESYTEEEASNSDYNTVVEAGSKQCVEDLYKNNVIVSTDFSISVINKVFTSKTSTSIKYQFEVTLKNSAGVSLDLTLNLKQSIKSSDSDVKLVSYFVLGTSIDQSETLVSEHSQDTQTANCQQVSSAQIETDTEVQAAINYGAQEVATKISEKFETSSDFEITGTQSVHQEVVNSSSYKVKVTMQNSEGKKADCHYSVNYSSSTSVKQVISYNYIVY